MKDEELLEAFERVENFVDYQYNKSHGNLFLLVGIFLFLLMLLIGYGGKIPSAPLGGITLGMFVAFALLYFLFGERRFRFAHRVGAQEMSEEEEASLKKKNSLATISSFLTLGLVFVIIWGGIRFFDLSFFVVASFSMGVANIINFFLNKWIYGSKRYHGGLFWVGIVFFCSIPLFFVLPERYFSLFTASVFFCSYAAVAFRIYADADRMLRESITGDLGRLLPTESKLSNPVRLGVMILLRAKSRMIFSEVQKALGLTPGNLDSHLRHLEKSGHITIKKGLTLKGPRTIVKITEEGEKELNRYVAKLRVALSYEEMKK
jgi:DNA-binding MarR family transcriptional regulator